MEHTTSKFFRHTGITAQGNQSSSLRKDRIRVSHFQLQPVVQAKLVHVPRGGTFVTADLCLESPSYGEWVSEQFSSESGEQIFFPSGFVRGFCTLRPSTEAAYRVAIYYATNFESRLIWNDPSLNIPWRVEPHEAILTNQDCNQGTFKMSPLRYAARPNV